jgi:Fe-S oxidoreductase
MDERIRLPERLVFFEGCATSRVLKTLRLSTYVFLDKAVEKGVLKEYKLIPNERCCGYGSAGIGDKEGAEECVKYNLNQLNRLGIKDVLFSCGACTAYLGEHSEFQRMGFKPINILEYVYALIETGEMDKLADKKLDPKVKITGHYSCHLRRTAGVEMEKIYRTIAKYFGAAYVEMSRPDACCGAGSEGEVMAAIAERKVHDAGKTGADLCPLGCAGCEALLKQVGAQKGVKTKFISVSALAVSCFSDLNERLEKYKPEVKIPVEGG